MSRFIGWLIRGIRDKALKNNFIDLIRGIREGIFYFIFSFFLGWEVGFFFSFSILTYLFIYDFKNLFLSLSLSVYSLLPFFFYLSYGSGEIWALNFSAENTSDYKPVNL